MRLPILSAPVKRPELIHPHACVDLVHGRIKDLVDVHMDLLHGANYNDPPDLQERSYQEVATSKR